MTPIDYAGWIMVGTLLAAMWTIVGMVVYDPPVLMFRFIAPLLALSVSIGLVIMGLDATN